MDISQRPAIVEERSRLGDWEADTVVDLGHKNAPCYLGRAQNPSGKNIPISAQGRGICNSIYRAHVGPVHSAR